VLTIDSNKVTPSLGASVRIGNLRLDAVYAHTFAEDVTVAPKDARVVQTVPLKATPPKNPDYINGGTYSWDANVVGLGMTYTFGHPDQKKTEEKPKDDGRPTTDEPQPGKDKTPETDKEKDEGSGSTDNPEKSTDSPKTTDPKKVDEKPAKSKPGGK